MEAFLSPWLSGRVAAIVENEKKIADKVLTMTTGKVNEKK
jgi:hypothetical protein